MTARATCAAGCSVGDRDGPLREPAEAGEGQFRVDREARLRARARQHPVVDGPAAHPDRRADLHADPLDGGVRCPGTVSTSGTVGEELRAEAAAVHVARSGRWRGFPATRGSGPAVKNSGLPRARRRVRSSFPRGPVLCRTPPRRARARPAPRRSPWDTRSGPGRQVRGSPRAGREALRVQLRARREEERDADQRRREASVFVPGDRVFGLQSRAVAEDVAGVGEAGDRHGFDPQPDLRGRGRGGAEQQRCRCGETAE